MEDTSLPTSMGDFKSKVFKGSHQKLLKGRMAHAIYTQYYVCEFKQHKIYTFIEKGIIPDAKFVPLLKWNKLESISFWDNSMLLQRDIESFIQRYRVKQTILYIFNSKSLFQSLLTP